MGDLFGGTTLVVEFVIDSPYLRGAIWINFLQHTTTHLHTTILDYDEIITLFTATVEIFTN